MVKVGSYVEALTGTGVWEGLHGTVYELSMNGLARIWFPTEGYAVLPVSELSIVSEQLELFA